MPSLRVGSRLRTYKPGLDRVEAWPVELRNSTGWSSGRSSWSSRWLLPSSFACPVELLPCAKSLHAPYVPYAPECSKRPISKDQTCIFTKHKFRRSESLYMINLSTKVKNVEQPLKKRLNAKKGKWSNELDGVLWSYQKTPRSTTSRTPFSLLHGMEAMSPAEVGLDALRWKVLPRFAELNNNMILDHLDYLEDEHSKALLRIQNYQQAAARFYNRPSHLYSPLFAFHLISFTSFHTTNKSYHQFGAVAIWVHANSIESNNRRLGRTRFHHGQKEKSENSESTSRT
ncbi:unnamed protein product [Microthlaspi erraticum]|uniref:Uncharacterized protein n=1 Tax=Microthlaspi erraticum TaxID=1685480 RepID=A0A6D2IK24_9BRAS|nr:unnamed protein product [Microthlaspi erraticum]